MKLRLVELKGNLEIIALVLGITAALFTFWQQIKPKGGLVVEVNTIEVGLPQELAAALKQLPDRVSKSAMEVLSKKLDASSLKDVGLLARSVAKDSITDSRGFDLYSTHYLFVANIRNTSSLTLNDVCLRFPISNSSLEATIISEGEDTRSANIGSLLKIGDLRPMGLSRVVIWSWMPVFSDNLVVTHKDGVGSVISAKSVEAPLTFMGLSFSYSGLALLLACLCIALSFSILLTRLNRIGKRISGA